jgi:precorrin-2 dehydrogenase/sirohydrochlorin ferrochelatase
MPFGFPIFLELTGKRSVVIGNDAIREHRVQDLLAAGADDILVVATGPGPDLEAVEDLGGVTVERRGWQADDLNGAFLCVAASRDAGERTAIAREARCRRVLVNVMDDIPNCDWSTPSIVRRGELTVAIATGGASPALSKQLRLRLSETFGEEWAEILVVLRRVREETMEALPDFSTRAKRWAEALDIDEAIALVRAGDAGELARRLKDRLLRVPDARMRDGDTNGDGTGTA